MSFYEDYVADGLCCECCGVFIDGTEPGYPLLCPHCDPDTVRVKKTSSQKRNARKRRAKQRARAAAAKQGNPYG